MHRCRTITYKQLHAEVCKTANALKSLGIGKGDRVCFYMPMVPELAIGVLACARIGAVHSVVFAGFSAQALADRINDATCKMVICSDYNNRGPKHIPVKKVVDEAMDLGCPSIETILVHKIPAMRSPGVKKMFGGMRWLTSKLRTALLKRWIVKICSSFSTLPVLRVNPKVWYTPVAATWSIPELQL
jgi:acyl-coenzyme A synthetase/AMP-(fatty) acid ligase